ncbi:MAG: hypothetical protein OXB98_12625 [Bryobacterales bacterium]|nr:hypothetical protein [Bryobacterales bacterium]
MRIRHLSTEELLLRCEAELGFERATHLDECEACRTALVELVELLDDAEQELRGTVPADTAAERAAAWDAIEQQIGKPVPVLAFPARWAAAYAVAAVLGFAVFSGITEMDLFGPSPVADPVTSAGATLPEPPALEPAVPEPVPQERVSIESPAVAESELTETIAAAPAASDPVIAEKKTFERYRAEPSVPEAVPAVAVSFSEPPEVAAARSTMASLLLPTTARLIEPIVEPRVIEQPPLTLAAAKEVIEGHWILHRAKVWREDIAPIWTNNGLAFVGAVDNEQVRDEVAAAIRSAQKGREVPLELRLRPVSPNSDRSSASTSLQRGVAGGVVRTTLLAHYRDVARRSFASTEPSELEGELDRFMNSVFENQSNLLAHLYQLNALVSDVPEELVLDVASSSRFVELAVSHTNAARQHQARIYDLLSESLPRKYWSYKTKDGIVSFKGLHGEAKALLQDALELDANLTTLLSTPQHLLDAADANVSCGEALSRIRTRLSRIKADTAKLR